MEVRLRDILHEAFMFYDIILSFLWSTFSWPALSRDGPSSEYFKLFVPSVDFAESGQLSSWDLAPARRAAVAASSPMRLVCENLEGVASLVIVSEI